MSGFANPDQLERAIRETREVVCCIEEQTQDILRALDARIDSMSRRLDVHLRCLEATNGALDGVLDRLELLEGREQRLQASLDAIRRGGEN